LTTFLPYDAENVSVRGFRRFDKQGRSSFMYSFLGTFTSGGCKQSKEFILKLFGEETVEKGRKEFAILKTLKEQNLAVPTAYCFKENNKVLKKPFMIMERIVAKNASDYLMDGKDVEGIVKKMAECLVDIHKVNLSYVEISDVLQRQYEVKQKSLLDTWFFINKHCMSFLGFSPPYQRRFIAAVKRVGYREPKKVCPALLHLDYEPNHILLSKGHCIVVDWGEASVGDPAYDVAWTYHKLRLERESAKVDLGEYFVQCYERYRRQKLVNLQFFKDIVAIEMAKWCGFLHFGGSNFRNYAKIMSLFFGDAIGELMRALYIYRLGKVMAGHHTPVWTNIEYIQNYALRYLERDRYQTKD